MYPMIQMSYFLVFAFLCNLCHACSRVQYDSGPSDQHRIVVGRTMDWLEPTNSSLFVFPAGMRRHGHAGENSLEWTSRYGSVITTMYDIATVDGMNSEGLVANGLYLADGDYGRRDSSRPGLSLGLWIQYFLDRYPTVADAAKDLRTRSGKEKFQVATREVVPGVPSLCHMSLSDRSGDSMIMEYLDGELTVHHDRKYGVMTNEPSFDQQLAINAYWEPIANYSLPGTDRPADRFVRLSHYLDVAPHSKDMTSSIAATAGMMRAVSVPLEPSGRDNPNVAPTLWRTYADTRSGRYFYESATEPVFFWVDLDEFDLSHTGHVMRLPLDTAWEDRVGDMSRGFRRSKPFDPMNVPDDKAPSFRIQPCMD